MPPPPNYYLKDKHSLSQVRALLSQVQIVEYELLPVNENLYLFCLGNFITLQTLYTVLPDSRNSGYKESYYIHWQFYFSFLYFTGR